MFASPSRLTLVLALPPVLQAQSHSLQLINRCGSGLPTLVAPNGQILATQARTYFNASIFASAFLNTGTCGPNGENCTAVDVELGQEGTISTASINITHSHTFSVPVAFSFFNGCNGASSICLSEGCEAAVGQVANTSVVSCNAVSAGVAVTFCPDPSYSNRQFMGMSSSSQNDSGALTPAVIAAIVIAVLGFAAFFVFMTYVFISWRRRHRHQQFKTPHSPPPSSTFPEKLGLEQQQLEPNDHALSQLHTRSLRTEGAFPNVTSRPITRYAELDGIVERLAAQFGWTASKRGTLIEGQPAYGQQQWEELPQYRST